MRLLHKGWLKGLAAGAALAAALLLAVEGGARQPQPRSVAPRGELAADEKSTIEIFRRSSPSVAYITTLDQVINLWTMNVREVPRGTGSGFVWDEQGHIVTNFHVVSGATAAKVRLADQHTYDAKLVGGSPENDLAVLKIQLPANRPLPIPLGSSRDLLVGQRVVAIGNPFGLDHTLTTGVVSALDRSLDGEDGRTIHHLIQTDAAINPGNSGGPLLDSAGRLIGVNTAIYSPSGASAGIGFAIPADTVNRVVPEIIATGQYKRPSLGFSSSERISSLIARELGVKGVVVIEVAPGSPAAAAGIRPSRRSRDGGIVAGDVVQAIDGTPVNNVSDLDRLLDTRQAGESVRLTLWRDGRRMDMNLPLAVDGRR
ncbi:MAG: trypsin-like peptidase domain-containing protein [Rhodocyclaceae bacterium]|jgi:S1-C subfamily serine protease|nr:trypsin-like peptidase domain-containing protein [Rhodocyclaceae bacterium]